MLKKYTFFGSIISSHVDNDTFVIKLILQEYDLIVIWYFDTISTCILAKIIFCYTYNGSETQQSLKSSYEFAATIILYIFLKVKIQKWTCYVFGILKRFSCILGIKLFFTWVVCTKHQKNLYL